VTGKKNITIPLASVVLILILVFYHHLKTQDVHTVIRVFDGDTIQIDDGRIIRFIGVDAPEVQSPYSREEPFGQESRRYLDSLLLHKKVLIRVGDPPLDKYSRTLAYVYLGDVLVNGRIIRDGWASSYRQFNHPWRDLFLFYENEARSKGLGIWKKKEQEKESRVAE
jgi:micrococcal nuclease